MIGQGAPHNPFCSERVRPGQIPYLLPPPLTIESLLADLESNRYVGQIIGPHGTGKSTLLHHLASELGRIGRDAVLLQAGIDKPSPRRDSILLLDSAERLPRPRLRSLIRRCRITGSGLVLTTHTDLRLPTLLRTHVTLESACAIVNDLLRDSPVPPPSDSEIDALLHRHRYNLRLTLFSLYDWYESHESPYGRNRWILPE